MPIGKKRTVTRTKTYDYHSPKGKFFTSGGTKSVVVKGKDGKVKRTKDVQKSYSNKYGKPDAVQLAAKGRTPALVTKTRKKKDGTTVTKKISRRGTSNNQKWDHIDGVRGSVDKSKRKVTKQIQDYVTDRGTLSPLGNVGAKKRTVTKTKAAEGKKATKLVVVKGKDGKVKKSKHVVKSPSKKSLGPTYVSKSKKNKDGTITNKDIVKFKEGREVRKIRDFPLPPTTW
jgi:hypothetical protein